MTDLVEFIRARLDEDEHLARELSTFVGDGVWRESGGGLASGDYELLAAHRAQGSLSSWHLAHIVRHDPARVLREVAAKRRLLMLRANAAGAVAGAWEGTPARNRIVDHAYLEAITDVLEELATAWADHPDYRSEWSPAS